MTAKNHLAVRCAARSTGWSRITDQDMAYPGNGFLAVVADGFGAGDPHTYAGQVAGDTLSARIEASSSLGDLMSALQDVVASAGRPVRGFASSPTALQGSGMMLTAMAWSGSDLPLVHVGERRAYVFRDRVLLQLAHNRTLVQVMIDRGEPSAAATPLPRSPLS